MYSLAANSNFDGLRVPPVSKCMYPKGSQFGQDMFTFHNFFKEMTLAGEKGFYIDSGANDATVLSNTLFYDVCRCNSALQFAIASGCDRLYVFLPFHRWFGCCQLSTGESIKLMSENLNTIVVGVRVCGRELYENMRT